MWATWIKKSCILILYRSGNGKYTRSAQTRDITSIWQGFKKETSRTLIGPRVAASCGEPHPQPLGKHTLLLSLNPVFITSLLPSNFAACINHQVIRPLVHGETKGCRERYMYSHTRLVRQRELYQISSKMSYCHFILARNNKRRHRGQSDTSKSRCNLACSFSTLCELAEREHTFWWTIPRMTPIFASTTT